MSQFPPQGNEPGSKGFDTEISEWIWSILECGGEVKGGGRGVESGMAAAAGAKGGSGLSRIWQRRGEKASSGQSLSPLNFYASTNTWDLMTCPISSERW